jgi:hypothetical protein
MYTYKIDRYDTPEDWWDYAPRYWDRYEYGGTVYSCIQDLVEDALREMGYPATPRGLARCLRDAGADGLHVRIIGTPCVLIVCPRSWARKRKRKAGAQ